MGQFYLLPTFTFSQSNSHHKWPRGLGDWNTVHDSGSNAANEGSKTEYGTGVTESLIQNQMWPEQATHRGWSQCRWISTSLKQLLTEG